MQNLVELLKESCLKYPRRRAIIYKNKSISYRSLVERIVHLSQRLSRLGIKRGDLVGILMANSADFVISYFAILNLEAVVIPLNNFLKPEELQIILEDSALRFIFTDSTFAKTIEYLKKATNALVDCLFIDRDLGREFKFFRKPLKNFGLDELKSNTTEKDLAVILYTSGTTGQPKGAMLSHGNLLFDVLTCVKAIEVAKNDNFICMLPLFHSFPSTVCVLLPFAVGATTTIVEGVRPFSKVLKAILRHRVTVFVSIPAIYNVLVNVHFPRFIFFPLMRKIFIPLRLAISGAAALPPETLKRFEEKFDVPLLEGYGLTETSPVVSLNPLKGARIAGSVGRPLEGIEVRVVDENDKDVAQGVVGELLVKGENVTRGYFNKPNETKEALKEGWLYTGDLAKIDKDGFIYIIDRKKDMINVRGLKVYPREVEEVFFKHPAIKEVAVVGIKDEHHGEVPKAFVVLKEGTIASEHELLHFLRTHIAGYKVPRCIDFRDSLPKTASGKISKRSLDVRNCPLPTN
ncbi:MAG: long-chain fatty acid--CoA ligase [Candidatus Omnitrophota bacterium]